MNKILEELNKQKIEENKKDSVKYTVSKLSLHSNYLIELGEKVDQYYDKYGLDSAEYKNVYKKFLDRFKAEIIIAEQNLKDLKKVYSKFN